MGTNNNTNLRAAKKAKNDEFYTQYNDIQREMNAYIEFNPDVFKDKIILLPCDDPEWSNFTKFFAQNFVNYGIKKLISTSFAVESKQYNAYYQPSLFEEENPKFDPDKTRIKGKIFVLDRDSHKGEKINIDSLEWNYLEGDGSFLSEEVKKLRDEADIIITNPPFSLFREFVNWIYEANKQFVIMGNKNAITYREMFDHIKNNELWVGATPMTKEIYFDVPQSYIENALKENKLRSAVKIGDKYMYRAQSIWYSNIDHGRRHQPLDLMTMADNIKFSKHKEIKGKNYDKYDNYDAIEIPFTDAIPKDYEGVMGVPISFLDKYCPTQFELLGIMNTGEENLGIRLPNTLHGRPLVNGKELYLRILIKQRKA